MPFNEAPEDSRGLVGSAPSIEDMDMDDFEEGVGNSRPVLLIEDVMVESRGCGGGWAVKGGDAGPSIERPAKGGGGGGKVVV